MKYILEKLMYPFDEKRTLKFAKALCEHMLYIYNYFYTANSGEVKGDLAKEALGMLDTWQQVSGNIFKHKISGVALEIKTNEDISELTKQVFIIENSYGFRKKSAMRIKMLERVGVQYVDDYFKSHQVKG